MGIVLRKLAIWAVFEKMGYTGIVLREWALWALFGEMGYMGVF